jgi:redox-sensing transcriptional repressor
VSPSRVERPLARGRGIPEATVSRLPLYHRALMGFGDRGVATVSSEELATAAGVNSAKLRKDLSHLGSYGTRGVGYDVDYLVYQIARELGLTQDWQVVIVGVGNLGHASGSTACRSSRSPGSRRSSPNPGSRSPSWPRRRPRRRRSATASSRPA